MWCFQSKFKEIVTNVRVVFFCGTKGFLQVHLGNDLENVAPLKKGYLGYPC